MKIRKAYCLFMALFAAIIALNFGIHVRRTAVFNATEHTVSPDAPDAQCSIRFAPQSGNTSCWEKQTTINGEAVKLNACVYEGTLTNTSEVPVSEWTMRMDISQDCYLNSAWCGTVEIHQFRGTTETVQTLDLRAVDRTQVIVDYIDAGDILLFPLQAGDYLIYHPSTAAMEFPITGTADEAGQVVIGMIFYWDEDEDFALPAAEVDYRMNKSYTQGTEARIARITVAVWALFAFAGLSVYLAGVIMVRQAKRELRQQAIEQKTTERMLDQTIKALAYAIDAKDEYTHGHSERVAQYSLRLAQALRLPAKECKEVFYAGLVHDVGKIAIPSAIINKPGRLTDEEYDAVKSHPERGEKILRQIEDMPYLAVGAKYHHERYDGRGYPCGVKGTEIPLSARIIGVADAYDAMTSQRSYRDTLPQSIVKQEIWKGTGTQFDPLIAKHMIALIDADTGYDMREKPDETYGLINRIRTSEFWDSYDPKSIRSEVHLMAETDIKYFAQFIVTVDHWLNPIRLAEVTGDGAEVRFRSQTRPEAKYIWHAPSAILYSADDGEPAGREYLEHAVCESAGYSWKTGIALSEEITVTRTEAFGSWDHWQEKNRAGMEYTLRARKDGNRVELELECELMIVHQTVVLPADFARPVYVCITGELCDITVGTVPGP